MKLYLDDPYAKEFAAEVTASEGGWVALSRSLFHPGGGGQLPDKGELLVGDERYLVSAVREDDTVWHEIGQTLPLGTVVRGVIDWPWRYALMRHHALMHVVNTIARDSYGGVMTGAQLGTEQSRIDFRLPAFSREQIPAFEAQVNAVIARGLAVSSSIISEEEFRSRPELVRTLNVAPPVVDGRVRIVTIENFDAQACGGTHVHTTTEIGVARLTKFDNKGKDNKRFYWQLSA